MENTSPNPAPQSGGWKVMGIIALCVGVFSILFAFIPCLGAFAMYFGIIAAVLSIIALVMANSAQASKTIAIIALVISLASIAIGYWQATVLKAAVSTIDTDYKKMKAADTSNSPK